MESLIQIRDGALTLAAIAFLTFPIWYYPWAASRALKEWEREQREKRRSG